MSLNGSGEAPGKQCKMSGVVTTINPEKEYVESSRRKDCLILEGQERLLQLTWEQKPKASEPREFLREQQSRQM